MNTLRYRLRIISAFFLGMREARYNLTQQLYDWKLQDAYDRGRHWARWLAGLP